MKTNNTIKKTRVKIPDRVKLRLWVSAGGRCEYDGCNKDLLTHETTKRSFNTSYIAHIVAAEPQGPRGDEIHSPLLALEFDNLMLLCDGCHRLIDREDIAGHPVDRLILMKKKHEERIAIVTGIKPERNSHIILYGANIGAHISPLSYNEAAATILPEMFPANNRAIELSLGNCSFQDHSPEYWSFQEANLTQLFSSKVVPIIEQCSDVHFSIFALAPMPLLIRLGTLLPDLYSADIYQRQREPQTWKWQKKQSNLVYRFSEPEDKSGEAILVISISATISHDRVRTAFPTSNSIWEIFIDEPHNGCIKTKEELAGFRVILRRAFDKIKDVHGQNAQLFVFPAMPVSASVEMGRVRMPKADLDLVIYDHNRHTNSFIQTITIQ
jgi:hypothetical protein